MNNMFVVVLSVKVLISSLNVRERKCKIPLYRSFGTAGNNFVLQVTVDNEDSDESYDSSWSYMQHIQSNALLGHDRRTFHKELTETRVMRPYRHHASPCLLVDFRLCFSDI